jgi:FkbM family methyltransferase
MRRFRSTVRELLYRVSPSFALTLHASLYWLRKVEPEIRLMPARCELDALSVDVGAHYGIYSYFMARHSRRVIAFEPNPVLAGRFARIGSNIQVEQLALSDTAGSACLTIPMQTGVPQTALASIHPGHDHAGMEVIARRARLDALDLGNMRVGFIKIDVEGHELDVLNGCAGVLAQHRPTMLIEAEERHRPDAVDSVRDDLSAFGYQGYFLCQSRLHPIETFTVARHLCISDGKRIKRSPCHISTTSSLSHARKFWRVWRAT